LPEVGERIMIPVEVTRHGRNTFDTVDTITIRLPGVATPVTVTAKYLLGGEED
jgi:hypothetical protein